MKEKKEKVERKLGFVEALILLLILIAIIFCNAIVLKIGTGLSILSVAMVLGAYGMLALHIPWDRIQASILKVISNGMGAILILLMVGFIGSSWTASGTTPMLIYYGLDMISPGMYMIVAFLLCMIMGMATGSAWAIMTSVGLALMGVAQGLGIPTAPAAAAIAMGSYIGDMWSPFSDVPNLTAACTRGTSFDVFKAMMPTMVPSVLVTIAVYGILGIRYASGSFDNSAILEIQNALTDVYSWNVLLLLPMIIVIGGVAIKKPVIPTLIVSSLVAVAEGVIFQGMDPVKAFNVLYSGVTANTGIEAIDALLSGGGLSNMMSMILIIFCAFIFAGVIDSIGLLKVLLSDLANRDMKPSTLIYTTIVTSIGCVYLTGSVYVSQILNFSIWNDAYKRKGMSTMMNGVVVTGCCDNWGMIVPWSAGTAVMLTTFGVTWTQYAPYLITTWAVILFNILFAALGKFTVPIHPDELEEATQA